MDVKGRTALVTGASRGLGVSIATLLAERGAKVVLVARSAPGLEAVAASIRGRGGEAAVVAWDLAGDAAGALAAAEAAAGPIDIVVNNAGVESLARFTDVPPDAIATVLKMNLEVPMTLCRAALPGMIERGRGHLVNVSSLAGLAGGAHRELYCASKFGLVGFTRALRASLRAEGRPVSASVVCPGFVTGDGMFADVQKAHGLSAPRLLGASTPEDVARGVLSAIERDRAEVIVNPGPIRPLLALGAMWPSLVEWLSPKFGADDLARAVVEKGGVAPR